MKLFNQSIKFPVYLVSSDDLVMTQSSANEQLIDSTQKINNQSQEPVNVPLSSLSLLSPPGLFWLFVSLLYL